MTRNSGMPAADRSVARNCVEVFRRADYIRGQSGSLAAVGEAVDRLKLHTKSGQTLRRTDVQDLIAAKNPPHNHPGALCRTRCTQERPAVVRSGDRGIKEVSDAGSIPSAHRLPQPMARAAGLRDHSGSDPIGLLRRALSLLRAGRRRGRAVALRRRASAPLLALLVAYFACARYGGSEADVRSRSPACRKRV